MGKSKISTLKDIDKYLNEKGELRNVIYDLEALDSRVTLYSQCDFTKKVILSQECDINFDNCIFTQSVSSSHQPIKIDCSYNFSFCTFNNVVFLFIKEGKVKIFGGTFSHKYGAAITSIGEENGEVEIDGAELSELSISGVEIKKSKESLPIKSVIKNLSIKQSTIKKALIIQEVIINNLFFSEIVYHEAHWLKVRAGVEILNNNRYYHTYLKQTFLVFGDKLTAQTHHFYEMEAHRKEVSKWSKDGILLGLNLISNRHGLDYKTGLKFTGITGLAFYIIYILTMYNQFYNTEWQGWSEFLSACNFTIKNFFVFLFPSHGFNFIENSNPNSLAYMIDFLGRVFIGYGIYQTIQAFRKYGKAGI